MKRACLLVAILFAVTACGSQERSAPTLPKLPQPLADHMLGLLPDPKLLQRETIAAINAHQVRPSLQEELLGQVNALQAAATASRRQSLERWLRRHGAGPLADLRARRGVPVDDLYLRLVDAEPESFEAQWAFLAQMTAGQRALFTLTTADGEINNGGVSQLFLNASPAFAAEAAAGARLVGAHEYADVLARAVALFPAARPLSRSRAYTEPSEGALGRLDDRWYTLEERRLPDDYIRRYVERHPEEFFR